MRRSRRPSLVHAERGSASLVAVAMMMVLLTITIGGVYVGSAVIARHRAQAAADLAAIAAAMHLAAGTGAACSQAAALASAMSAAVIRCEVEDLDVVITVETRVSLGRIGGGVARATARAGPADSS
ncbi:MAG TPA: Rv3654c family TadE-like protein [Mycobacterium sp.]|nr:Rv3654c family TadE-like protein [Mycobacterium sp.]